MWSSLYDNIQESPDCPSNEVINDDDMLDGWMIIQKRNREQAKLQKDAENKFGNKKISNADEVFIVKDYYNQPDQKPEDFAKEVESSVEALSISINSIKGTLLKSNFDNDSNVSPKREAPLYVETKILIPPFIILIQFFF